MGSKRGPLSKAEIFYVTEHVKMGKDINGIASDLDRPAKSIEKYIAKAQKENTTSKLTSGDQFVRKNGAVIMTENASTLGDVTRQRNIKKTNPCITTIKKT